MSFHGGLAGVAVALLLWSRRRSVPLWNLADGLALVAPIGLFLGRLANFVNAELVGRSTQVRWGVVFPGENFARHPSQLYEAALEGPLLLGVLWVAGRLRSRPGRIAGLFLTVYGAFRFLVEFTREPDPQLGFIAFGWLTMGQLLSAALVLVGVLLILGVRASRHPAACGSDVAGTWPHTPSTTSCGRAWLRGDRAGGYRERGVVRCAVEPARV
jgi:phosphatidylglycerol:prolipoprotein diacylglycerol transferase